MVTSRLGQLGSPHVIGVHVNTAILADGPMRPESPTAQEQRALASLDHHLRWGMGYATQQGTRSQTHGYRTP